MSTQNTNGLNYIIQAINNIVEPKVSSLKYDKTYRAKVTQQIDTGIYMVQINNIEYRLSYSGTLNVGDIVKVKAPLNNFSDIYIESLPGSGGGSGGTTNYNDLTNKPVLDTSLSSAQATNSSEIIRGTISLHRISKTGNYNDLLNKPELNFIPTSQKGVANGVATLDSNTLVPKSQLPADTVYDSNYVHTDNNFTTTLKTKLDDIEAGAQVNTIETIQKNGINLTITNKTVNVEVPTQTSELTNNGNDGTSPFATESYVDGKVSSVYKYKGSVTTYSNLPTTGNEVGDVWNVEDTGKNYAWTGTTWDDLGGTVDLSNYYTKTETYSQTEVNSLLNNKVNKSGDTMTGNLIVPTVIGSLQGNASTATQVNNSLIVGDKTYNGSTDVIITKSDIGLGNVTNDLQVKASEMGVANGVATLGTDSKVIEAQLPIASNSSLGAVKVGTNLTILEDGTLNSIVTNVIDNLTSTSGTDALSANQGRILDNKIQVNSNSINTIQSDMITNIQQNGVELVKTNNTVNVIVPTKLSELTNDANYVVDANYVHTDNNFTTVLKDKLNGIEENAQVNIIESVKQNGIALQITNKSVDVTVPTQTSDLSNNGSDGTSTYVEANELGTAASKNVGTSVGEIPILGDNGKLAESVIPSMAITEVFVVNSESAMLALDAQPGDVAIRTDLNKTFILQQSPASTLSNWVELLAPTDSVLSVNGETGNVVLTSDNINVSSTTQSITDKLTELTTAISSAGKRYTTTIGNGADTSFFINHGLNSSNCIIQVSEANSPYSVVIPDIALTSENSCTISFREAPDINEFKVNIIG